MLLLNRQQRPSSNSTGLNGAKFVAVNFGSPEAPPAVDGTVLQTEEQRFKRHQWPSSIKLLLASKLGDSFTGDKIDNARPLTDFRQTEQQPYWGRNFQH